jgi:hypothetical protein
LVEVEIKLTLIKENKEMACHCQDVGIEGLVLLLIQLKETVSLAELEDRYRIDFLILNLKLT